MGIVRRAEKRGKELPPMLKEALEEVVGGGVLKASSSRIYDARGNGDGKTIPTLTGDHENRITDYTALCVERKVDE